MMFPGAISAAMVPVMASRPPACRTPDRTWQISRALVERASASHAKARARRTSRGMRIAIARPDDFIAANIC